jgi:tetratricopeptide (TPR) repeat protein
MQNLFAAALAHHQGGRLAEAEKLYRQVLAVDPRHADALHYLGVVALNRSRAQEAVDLIGKSLAANKRNAEAHYHMGLAYAALGRFEEVEKHNRRAVSLKPDHAQAHLNLGNAQNALGRKADAAASYRRAITLAPTAADPHFNLANILFDTGQMQNAVTSYETALLLRPDHTQARHNLATTLLMLNRPDDAIAHFDKAIAAQPDFVDALVGRALAAMNTGDHAAATRFVCRSLAIRATDDARQIFCQCVAALADIPDAPGLRDFMVAALSEPWDRPRNLVRAATLVLRSGGPTAAVIARFDPPARNPPAATRADLAILAGDLLLRAVLENTPLWGLDLEAALAAARRALLDAALADDADAIPLAFACALARQCDINEYVFDLAADESAELARLRARLAAALSAQTQPSALVVAAAGAYVALHTIAHAERLLQWCAPAAIEAARATIPRLTAIDDQVSQKVREQYEQNPYPRWVKAAPGRGTRSIDAHLRKTYPQAPFRDLNTAQPEMLIAGCGTGQFANEFAQFIENARVLAVDLSLASLAYAKSKTVELGLTNIDYAQADIVTLPQTGKSFDIIESGGVLHHMEDPFAAWHGLLDMLRPGGVMRLALYSERGRADVVAAREWAANGGYSADAEGIRRARRRIALLPPGSPAFGVTARMDFYALSDVRDLIFHVQEHRLTLAQMAAFIEAQKLTFIGFHMSPAAALYAARFPQDPAMTDLASWDVLERENPHAFAGMYQFWVQKPA